MMIVLFYIFSIITILSTICAILNYHPVHALLFLVVSFLSISCIFFCLGASFAGVIEIIVYAGAIMILFIFVVMMLNTSTILSERHIQQRRNRFVDPILCYGSVLLLSILCIILIYTVFESQNYFIDIYKSAIDLKQVGVTLFGSYMLAVELASFLLLSALISVLHLAQEYESSMDCVTLTQIKEHKK